MANPEQMVKVNGVELCAQSFGQPADPAILLIMGAAASMDWWPDGFCERLAAGGRFVMRYDHRDTGRSVHYPAGAPGYTSDDLVTDAIGVLDAFGVSRAHLVGMSMGGMVAMTAALDHPDRVASLTLMSTSARPGDPDLPPSSEALKASFEQPAPQPDWSDRAAVIDYLVADARLYAGRSFDEAAARELAGRVVDRTADLAASMTNHWILEGGPGTGELRGRLGGIRVPALVLHGTEDPLFPYPHGVAMAAEIPGAELLPMEGVGHEAPPPEVWDVVVPAILRNSSG